MTVRVHSANSCKSASEKIKKKKGKRKREIERGTANDAAMEEKRRRKREEERRAPSARLPLRQVGSD